MHDLIEGITNDLLVNLLYFSIYEKGYFTVEFLNAHLTSFDYGLKVLNKPPQINKDQTTTKKTLKISASLILFLLDIQR